MPQKGQYPIATFSLDIDKSVSVICPCCGKEFCHEDTSFYADEIGECFKCHKLIYIPWEKHNENICN